MFTIRRTFRGHGRVRMNENVGDGSIDGNSVVVITASEFNTVGVDPHHRFLGDADVWVSNIAPHGPPADPNHGVEWILHVDFPNDIDVLIDITVLDSRVIPG
jgi:hypothetical protein